VFGGTQGTYELMFLNLCGGYIFTQSAELLGDACVSF